MRYASVECPRCGAVHEYLLSRREDRHLRQCPECAGWFLHDGAAGETEFLEDPPRCPVEGCSETLQPEELPVHVIEDHGGELVAE